MDSEPAAPLPELEEELIKVDSGRVVRMNLPEWPYIAVGLLGSIVMGGAMPVYAILFGEVLGVLKLETDEAREESVFYSTLFMAAGIVAGVAVFCQVTMFCIAGEHLTLRCRQILVNSFQRANLSGA